MKKEKHKSKEITSREITSREITSREITSYIIVNESLNMSKGKIASQASHGILSMNRFLLANNINHSGWLNNGEKIVVVKAPEDKIKIFLSTYCEKIPKTDTFNLFPIYDAGKTEVESGSLTVLATTPISDDKKPDFIKELKLL
jgi:peptidyl-tRNA hydrolase